LKQTHTPICPKCGYDQSGEIATWETQCPLDGRCPECGLRFAWADVLDPSRVDLIWYVEHAGSKRGMLRRTPATLFKLLIPNLYWRQVGVHTRIEFKGLIVWLLMIMAVLHALAIVPVGIGNWLERTRYNAWPNGTSFEQYFQDNGVAGLLYELHNAIGAPFVRIEYQPATISYHFGGYFNLDFAASIQIPSIFLSMMTIWAVIMLVVPTTRCRAQIRGAHVMRAWLMSLVSVIFIYEVFRVALSTFWWLEGYINIMYLAISFIAMLGLSLIWLMWFWAAAIRVGWTVRPSWLLIVLGMIASLIAGFTTIMYISVYA
jgi:hypothetical protein